MEYQNILVKIEDGVGLITLNRPKALNALNAELLRELIGVLEEWGLKRYHPAVNNAPANDATADRSGSIRAN